MERETFTSSGQGTAAAAPPSHLERFRQDERGSMVVFSLFILVLMLMIGGMAVDVIRFENTRSTLQSTLDRAVLAAANLSQPLPPSDVVKDYATKAGLIQYLAEPQVNDDTLNARNVTATAQATIPSIFMHMMGIETLTAPAASTAEERVTNVEVSLVLDYSGSMLDRPAKIAGLKDAAAEFLEVVLEGANTGEPDTPIISVSVVPYTGQVNIGKALLGELPNAQYTQPYSSCIEFSDSDFNTVEFDPAAAWKGTGNGILNDYRAANPDFCPEADVNAGVEIIPAGKSTTDLTKTPTTDLAADIKAMDAEGLTSIDIGMKWGVTLLDPSMEKAFASLIDKKEIDELFAGRPYDYDAPDTMKVIVLMTDGYHQVGEQRLQDSVKTGLSPVWMNTSAAENNDTYSVYNAATKSYWWYQYRSSNNNNTKWKLYPYGGKLNSGSCSCTTFNNTGSCTKWSKTSCTPSISLGTAKQLSFPDLWARSKVSWVANSLYAPAIPNADRTWISQVSNETKDDRLKRICKAAKDKGITVFTVAFEAATAGQNLLKNNCASTSGHHFNASDEVQIVSAFRSIASHISQLRLIQ